MSEAEVAEAEAVWRHVSRIPDVVVMDPIHRGVLCKFLDHRQQPLIGVPRSPGRTHPDIWIRPFPLAERFGGGCSSCGIERRPFRVGLDRWTIEAFDKVDKPGMDLDAVGPRRRAQLAKQIERFIALYDRSTEALTGPVDLSVHPLDEQDDRFNVRPAALLDKRTDRFAIASDLGRMDPHAVAFGRYSALR